MREQEVSERRGNVLEGELVSDLVVAKSRTAACQGRFDLREH